MCTNKCAQPEGHFSVLGASWAITQTKIKKQQIIKSESALPKSFCNFFALSEVQQFPSQGKCKNAIFSRTVFANEKTHLRPTLNTCKVGAWRAALKNFHFLLFSAQRLVHVCWCTLGALWNMLRFRSKTTIWQMAPVSRIYIPSPPLSLSPSPLSSPLPLPSPSLLPPSISHTSPSSYLSFPLSPLPTPSTLISLLSLPALSHLLVPFPIPNKSWNGQGFLELSCQINVLGVQSAAFFC